MTFAPDTHMEVAILDGSPFIPQGFVITRTSRETQDTFTVELEPQPGAGTYSFLPGQFNMVYIYGVGEIPISISGDPSDTRTLVHTTRSVGTVTRSMNKLRKGNRVGIRGPYGVPWPLEEAKTKDVVIIAGGIGLAPLRPSVYTILQHRDNYGKVALLYGTRTPADILFREELEQWRSRFDLEVYVTVDRAMTEWKGNVGVVTTLLSRASFDPEKTIAMICGPEVMMRFATMELMKRRVDVDRIYLSMERNMECGIGLCGHCQFGPHFVCKNGPVFRYGAIRDLLMKWEI